MIKSKFIAYALFFLSRALSQVDNLDWPNLGKYEKDNQRIKTVTKKGNRIVSLEILSLRVGIGIILNTLRKKGILTEESAGKQLRKCLSDFDLT